MHTSPTPTSPTPTSPTPTSPTHTEPALTEGATGTTTGPARADTSDDRRYLAPGWFTRHVFNRLVAAATRMGISVWGSRVLQVRGRRSGEVRETPVNLLTVDGTTYLVAPRGETQWVRNLRVAGEGGLRLGRTVQPFTADEVADAAKPAVLRAYLHRWKAEVGAFFDGVDASSSDEALAAIAPCHPVFAVDLGA